MTLDLAPALAEPFEGLDPNTVIDLERTGHFLR